MQTFKDALAPLSKRMVREHQILHISAELPPEEDATVRARTEILRWAQRRSGGRLPENAMAGFDFDLLVAGRNSSAVNVDLPEISAWALRQEDPDKDVPGRIWTSEAIIWSTPDSSPRFAARLTASSGETELDVMPAGPGYVRQLIDNVGLFIGDRPLSSLPWYIGDEAAEASFLELLSDNTRRLPLVVISVADGDKPEFTLNLDQMASALGGLAQIIAILPKTSWRITQLFSKRLSVFDGAVRLYMPGFDDYADPFDHPLWLGNRLISVADAAVIDRQIRSRVAQFSTRAVRLGHDIVPFSQLRSFSRKAEQERVASSEASDEQKALVVNELIQAYQKERDDAIKAEDDAFLEMESAIARAEEAERREYNATAKVQMLLERLSQFENVGHEDEPLPTDWEAFDDWAERTLIGRVVLTGSARRGCRKAHYHDVQQAARCLLWLAEIGRSRFMGGGGSLSEVIIEEGVRNSACGSDEFQFDWHGRRLVSDWHVKRSNDRSPENCLRIYYGWDDQT